MSRRNVDLVEGAEALEDSTVTTAVKESDLEGSPEDLQAAGKVEGDPELVEQATIENGTDPEAEEPDRSDLNLVTNTIGELVRVEKVGV